MLQVMLSQVHANPSVAAKGKSPSYWLKPQIQYSNFFSKPHLEELPGFIPVHFMISTPSVHKNTVSYKLCSTYVKSLSLSACWSCLLPELLELTASSNGFNISSSSCCWAIIKSNSWSSLTVHLIFWWLFPEFVFTCYLLAEECCRYLSIITFWILQVNNQILCIDYWLNPSKACFEPLPLPTYSPSNPWDFNEL